MAFLEKTHWVVLIIGGITVVAYMAMVLPAALSVPVSEVGYEQPLIASMVFFVLANIAGNVVCAASNPGECDKHDQRDREIDRYGERVGNFLIIAGSCAALAMALTRQDTFWIANVIFLAGLGAATLSAVVKIAAYHGPFQRW